MKIAVTYEDGQVFQHFGHTQQFKIYTAAEGKIQSSAVLNIEGSGHCALADVLKQNDIEVLICGGIGAGAKQALAALGIALYGGVAGEADRAVELFLANKLVNSDETCTHHSHHHHSDSDDAGHSCGGACPSSS